MLSLKAFLDRGFQRAFLAMNAVCFVLLSLIIFAISFLNTKDQLSRNLSLSAKATTDFLYSREVSKISDHFNAMGSSGVYNSISIRDKKSGDLIFESQFPAFKLVPKICAENWDSDIVFLKACTPVISELTLLILALLIFTYIGCVIFIYRIIRSRTLSVFESISESLIDPSDEYLPKVQIFEILEIKNKLKNRSNQIAELSKNAAMASLSKQVAHDMRSPLSAIMNILKVKSSDITTLENEVVLKSVSRLNFIAQNLLNETQNPHSLHLPNNKKFQLFKILKDVFAGKNFEFPNREISFSLLCSEDIYLWFNPLTFERIVSNVWNNSIEAASKNKVELKVEVQVLEKQTRIMLFDGSGGFSDLFFQNLKSEIKTTKTSGHGIGLKHAINELRVMGGELHFSNTDVGALVELIFNEKNYASLNDPIVLIDDDKYIRYSWTLAAEKNGHTIETFPNFDSFLQSSHQFDRAITEFFIDSDLGDSMGGEDVVKEIIRMGFQRVNMQTGSEANEFLNHLHLNSILAKTYPYT